MKVIAVEHLSKRYRLGELSTGTFFRDFERWLAKQRGRPDPYQRIGDKVQHGAADQDLWALRDLSFEVRYGEVLGVIGRNGAGKSTLLKVLSRVTAPTSGQIKVKGRIASLLEVGTGFHPELTGRENIYLNGAILGMTRKEVQRKFDEIVDFAGVERFIDTPVKRYSSGMYVRLAFAVAAHLEPEILVVDEVLAVGDAQFQKKCLGKMGQVAREGRTVLFVSHNMRVMAELCHNCIWLSNGALAEHGNAQDIIVKYLSSEKSESLRGEISPEMHMNATGEVFFQRASLLDKDGQTPSNFFFGEPIRLKLEFEVHQFIEDVCLIATIERMDGTLVTAFHSNGAESTASFSLEPGKYTALMEAQLPLTPGGYTLHLVAKPLPGNWDRGRSWDWVPRAMDFFVEAISSDGKGIVMASNSIVQPPMTWQIKHQ